MRLRFTYTEIGIMENYFNQIFHGKAKWFYNEEERNVVQPLPDQIDKWGSYE